MSSVPIATVRTRGDAELVRGLLASEGIDSWVVADDAGGAYPFALSGGIQVVIDESDREAAEAIVAGRVPD